LKAKYRFSTFWKLHANELPFLTKYVQHFGCVAATSVASESAFSVAGYVKRKNRCSLAATTVKKTMIMKNWQKLESLIDEKLPF
jgi:hypothetical protein